MPNANCVPTPYAPLNDVNIIKKVVVECKKEKELIILSSSFANYKRRVSLSFFLSFSLERNRTNNTSSFPIAFRALHHVRRHISRT